MARSRRSRRIAHTVRAIFRSPPDAVILTDAFPVLASLAFVIAAYLLGSVSFAVVKRLQAFAADHPHQLLERFAQAIADLLMNEFGAPWVKVRVAKLAAIPGVKELGVVIERGRA